VDGIEMKEEKKKKEEEARTRQYRVVENSY
jgi:hypothetical protein